MISFYVRINYKTQGKKQNAENILNEWKKKRILVLMARVMINCHAFAYASIQINDETVYTKVFWSAVHFHEMYNCRFVDAFAYNSLWLFSAFCHMFQLRIID